MKELVTAMSLDQKIALMQLQKANSGPYAGYERYLPANPDLCLPAITQQDDSAGVAASATGVTQLPAPEALASMWDATAARKYGQVIGNEMRGKGVDVALAPTINIVRVPQWGRAFETLGEDPYLTSRLGAADIEGLQSQHVVAQVKHYAAYNQETNRHTPADNVIASQRTLHEVYLPAFAAAVQQAHAGGIMCSFPAVNGTYSCENPYLVHDVLRHDWHFPGFVRSDSPADLTSTAGAVNAGMDQEAGASSDKVLYFSADRLAAAVADGQVSTATIDAAASALLYPMFQLGIFNHPPTGHIDDVVTTPAHAALGRRVAEQGTVLLKNRDHALPLGTPRGGSIAVIGSDAGRYALSAGGGSGYVTASSVVTPVQGIAARGAGTRVRYALGDAPYQSLPDIPAVRQTPASGSGHGVLVQYYPRTKLAGTPSLTRTEDTVDDTYAGPPVGSGSWSARYTTTVNPPTTGSYRLSLTCDRGCQLSVNGQQVIDNEVRAFQHQHTEFATVALTAGKPASVEVDYPSGADASGFVQLGWLPPHVTPPSITRAVALARRSRVAVVFAGAFQSEGYDQPSLNLPGIQDQLIEAVARANPHTIVVLNTGGPVVMPWLDKVAGVVEAWYPGQDDGDAIAALLFGDVNPGGKLPMTFPRSAAQTPTADPARYPGQNGTIQFSEGLDVGYRWYDAHQVSPLFPFGYGLSYSRFRFSDLHVTPGRVGVADVGTSGSAVTVRATVTNTGALAGDDVAQLYLTYPAGTGEPPRVLKGFQRVHLRPGRSERVTFRLAAADMTWWDTAANGWAVQDGTYQVSVGDSSAAAALPLRGAFTVRRSTTPQVVTVTAPSTLQPGTATVSATFANDADTTDQHVRLTLGISTGGAAAPESTAAQQLTAVAMGPTGAPTVRPHGRQTATWRVTVPTDLPKGSYQFRVTVTYRTHGRQVSSSNFTTAPAG